jgi:pimeloyl-ACP methyl ester carboxylesterase
MPDGPRDLSSDGPATRFRGQSRWTDLDGPLHYLDFGGPADGPAIVCVHGLGGSAVNWSAIAPLLTDRYRILAPDLAGHGLTQSAGRGTGVAANRVLLHRFIESVPGSAVILMGNSMGGMISLLEASAAPAAVAGLILIDPALPLVPARQDPLVTAMFVLSATPGLGRVMLSRQRGVSPEELVASTMSLCCEDHSRVPAEVVTQHVELVRRRAVFTDGRRDLAATTRSVVATLGFRGRAYRRGIRSITCPVLMLHGERDRVVPVAAARAVARVNPSWSLVVLPGVGHVPQLESAQDSARVIAEWLGSAGRRAAESATPDLSVNAVAGTGAPGRAYAG